MRGVTLVALWASALCVLGRPLGDTSSVQLLKRDGSTEFDGDLMILKKRDGSTEFDGDLMILKKRDGSTEFDGDLMILKD
ncbi:hypothetical protein GGR51DRAFT_563571 [Nemania sp. FL0031]|nr:hypothetical protein GGR51DRAFT_563571 [Nemania sp. FL0031]